MSESHLLNKTVIQNISSDLSNTDLDNLTLTGESHFQAPLVSGNNIKTINNNSILGSGNIVITSVPVGTILVFAGSSSPSGYLLCDGSEVSRTTYSELFSAIGTAYGIGDDSTTFNLPNFYNRFPEGNGNGYLSAGLPGITGTGVGLGAANLFTGAFKQIAYQPYTIGGYSGSYAFGYDFYASRSSAIYGASSTVHPATCKCYFCIKY